jgi:hypothetical protein
MDQELFVHCINSTIFSFSQVEFKIQHEMPVVSCHSGEAVSRRQRGIGLVIFVMLIILYFFC